MIAIVDYDAGNVRSVERAFKRLGYESVITSDPRNILSADYVVLPGVGNFGDAAGKLNERGLGDVIREVDDRGIPFLGICVGMQLLFGGSEESPGDAGLGILHGECLKFKDRPELKVPHMGWNSLDINGGKLFKGIPDGSFVYFVHSYYVRSDDADIVTACADYGMRFHASVERGNLFAVQFHPEKSGETGLLILKNFIDTGRKG